MSPLDSAIGTVAGIRDDVLRIQSPDRLTKARHRLEKAGAKVRDENDGVSVRLAGIRSHSTAGLYGALCNWLIAAGRRKALERSR